MNTFLLKPILATMLFIAACTRDPAGETAQQVSPPDTTPAQQAIPITGAPVPGMEIYDQTYGKLTTAHFTRQIV